MIVVKLNLVNYNFLEPVGLKSPAFSTKSETYRFKMKSLNDLNLMCDAQGYPIPAFRLETNSR